MNKRYAIVRQGVVENVGIIDIDTPQGANFLAGQLALGLVIESLDGHVDVGTGWIYDAQLLKRLLQLQIRTLRTGTPILSILSGTTRS